MSNDEMTPAPHGGSAAAASRGREVTHNDQLEVWAEELTFALMDWLKEPETYDDKVHMASAMKAEIKSIVETAFNLAEPSRLQPAAAAEPPTSGEGVDKEFAALLRCEEALREMVAAIKAGSIDSEELPGDPDSGIMPYKWHEEWDFHARAALTLLDEVRSSLPSQEKGEA